MALIAPLLISCLLLAAPLLFFFLIKKQHATAAATVGAKLPPGNLGYPWIGETFDFYRAQRRNKLYEGFVVPRAAKHGAVFKTRLMGDATVVVIGADANRFLLSNEFKLVVSSWPSPAVQLMGADCIMQKNGGRHRWLRGTLATSLTGAVLESLVPRLSSAVAGHFDLHWRGKSVVQLFFEVKALTFSIVLECLYGIKPDVGLLRLFEKVLTGVFALPIDLPGFKFWRAKRARKEVAKVLVGIVRERRKKMEEARNGGGNDEEMMSNIRDGELMVRLIEGLIAGEIKEEEVVDNLVLMVFAAHDTTAFAIAMMCRMLGHHPDVYSKLLKG